LAVESSTENGNDEIVGCDKLQFNICKIT